MKVHIIEVNGSFDQILFWNDPVNNNRKVLKPGNK